MQTTDPEIVATRNILLNWVNLSPGDISILHAALQTEGALAGTLEASANCVMWENFERLGWATRVFPALLPPSARKRPRFFTLTREGRNCLPDFLAHYDLAPGSYYVDKALPTPDPASFDRALESAADICLDDRRHPGLTVEARVRLRTLEARSVALALAAFAYDAKESVAAALAFNAKGKLDEAARELQALRVRIRNHWAFGHAGLPPPACSLHDLAAGLNIGLGLELATWLNEAAPSVPRSAAWLAQHGPGIESFSEHVRSRTALPPA